MNNVKSFKLFCSSRSDIAENSPSNMRGYALKAAVLKYNGYLRKNGIRNYARITGGKSMNMKLKIT